MPILHARRIYKLFPVQIFALLISASLLLVSFYTENFFMAVETPNKFAYISSKILFVAVIYTASSFIINFIRQVFNKDDFHQKWFKNLLFVLLPYGIVLLINWPGIIVWDEFWVYLCATRFYLDDWQSYLTVYFYLINLYLFPSVGTIVFSQIVLLSFISSWFVTKIEITFRSKKIKYVVFIFVVFCPAILFSTLVTYRSTVLAILELWLLGMLYFNIRQKTNIGQTLLWISVCTVLLSTWRKEGIYHLVLVPLSLLFLMEREKRKMYFAKVCAGILVGGLIVSGFSNVHKTDDSKLKYELTSYINPLSTLLVDKHASIDPDSIATLDKVLDIEKTKQMAYPYEIPVFWNGGVREGITQSDFQQFKKEFWKLAFKNVDIYLSQRLRTMLAASGFSPYGYVVKDYIGPYLDKGQQDVEQVEVTMANRLNLPLFKDLRNETMKVLDWSTSHDGVISNSMIFWNYLPILLVLIVIVIRVRTLKEPLFWIALICIGRVPILYIAEPGSYFMYYYPMYLTGFFVIALYVLEITRALPKKSVKLDK